MDEDPQRHLDLGELPDDMLELMIAAVRAKYHWTSGPVLQLLQEQVRRLKASDRAEEKAELVAAAWAAENAEALQERAAYIAANGMPLGSVNELLDASTVDDPMLAIEEAVDRIHDAYWSLCDAAGEALNPRDLGLPGGVVDLVDEDFDLALKVEDIAKSDGISWMEARNFV